MARTPKPTSTTDDFDAWQARWNKQLRRTVVFDPRDDELQVKAIPTGITAFDEVLGPYGGIPRKRATVIYGEPSSGKTLLAQLIIGSAQRQGGRALFFDVERTYDARWFELTGVDLNPNQFKIVQPQNLEQGFDMITDALETLRPDVLVVDSIVAMVPKAALKAGLEDYDPRGLQPRKMRQGIEAITQTNVNTAVILINQLRSSMQSGPYANPESLPGGKALKFHASLFIRCRRGKWLTDAGEGGDLGDVDEKDAKRTGFLLRLRVEKNKVGPPWGECDLKAHFTGDVDQLSSIVHLALVRKVIKQPSAGYFEVPGIEGKVHGRENLEQLLREDDKLRERIIKEVKR